MSPEPGARVRGAAAEHLGHVDATVQRDVNACCGPRPADPEYPFGGQKEALPHRAWLVVDGDLCLGSGDRCNAVLAYLQRDQAERDLQTRRARPTSNQTAIARVVAD